MRKDVGLSFAGEVSIDEVSIITAKGFIQTITNQVIGVQIYEDLFGPWITGKIVVKESHDLLNLFPLVGEEFVRIEISTPGLKDDAKFKGEFFIYNMTERVKTAHREVAYALGFISKEAVVDLNKRISKTYSGRISESVKSIITSLEGLETTKQFNIEDTQNATKHISNFWAPLRNINYLAAQAYNANGTPNYVFFENAHGLNFVSLDTLMEFPPYQEFTWTNYSQEINTMGGSVKNFNKDYQQVLELHTPETFDYIKRVESGMYASRMIHYDLVTKKYTDKAFSALTDIGKKKHLNTYPLVTPTNISKPSSMVVIDHKYYGNFNSYGDVTNTKTIQNRISLIQQMNAFRVEITVFGRTDYCVGQKVNLRVFKQEQMQESTDPEDYLDKIYSGNYLIAALSHTIDREKHECTMELVKESFIRNI